MPRIARHSTLSGPWLEMSVAAGSVAKLCEELDVDRMTFWRWAHRRVIPGKLVRAAVNRWATEHGISPPFSDSDKRGAVKTTRK